MSDLCILPNYHTVHLGLSNLSYKLKRKISREDFMRGIFNDAYNFFFLIFFKSQGNSKEYQQHITYTTYILYKEVHKKYIGCNLKTKKLPEMCAYKGMCNN